MTGPRLVRAIGLGVACLAVLWLSVAVTAAGVYRSALPEWALKLNPLDARAMGRAALGQFTRPGQRPDLAAAQQLAQAALARDPTAIDAVATLGIVAASRNDLPGAERLFHYAERLSRRSRETQIWLIERQVSRNDIDGALAQYDTALRTSETLRAQLFPILMSAMSDPNIAVRLNRLLLTRPNWYSEFTAKVAWEGRDPVAMVAVTRGLLDPGRDDHRQWLSAMLPRLVQLNRMDLAWRAYETLPGMAAPAQAPLRDGIFAVEAGLPPFDWAYAGEPHLAPERRSLGGASTDGYALYLPETDLGGDVASQALRLPPGIHRLAATVGNVSGDLAQRPFVQIRCAGRDGAVLTRQLFPNAGEAGAPLQAAFQVPAGCPYQLISIGVQARPGDERSGSAWIARLSLR
jgi:hypothetical protein